MRGAATSAESATPALEMIRYAVATTVPGTIAAVSRGVPASLDRYVAAVWFGLSALLLVLLGVVHARVYRLRRHWPVVDLYGLRVRLAPDGGPVVVGLSRSEIVVPRWLLWYRPEEQRLVLTHESEHVRARDPLLLAVGCAVVALLPWQPVAWWMLSRLRLAVELDCDARVLGQGVAPRTYGGLLVDLAGRCSGLPACVPALAARASHLQQRLLAMKPLRLRFPRARGSALTAFACMALLVACAAKAPVVATKPVSVERKAGDTVTVARTDSVSPKAPLRPDTSRAARAPVHLRATDSVPRVTPRTLAREQRLAPTYVIDGVRLTASDAASMLARIDSSSIETVEVLKGRSASDLYGADPEAGVILITTKNGQRVNQAQPVEQPQPSYYFTPLYVVDGVMVSDTALWTRYGSAPQQGQAQPRITVTFQDAPLSQVIENFAAFAGRNIVLAPDVGDPHVTADIRNVEWQLGLDQILAPLGLVARVDASGVIRVERRSPAPAGAQRYLNIKIF